MALALHLYSFINVFLLFAIIDQMLSTLRARRMLSTDLKRKFVELKNTNSQNTYQSSVGISEAEFENGQLIFVRNYLYGRREKCCLMGINFSRAFI